MLKEAGQTSWKTYKFGKGLGGGETADIAISLYNADNNTYIITIGTSITLEEESGPGTRSFPHLPLPDHRHRDGAGQGAARLRGCDDRCGSRTAGHLCSHVVRQCTRSPLLRRFREIFLYYLPV